MRLGKANSGEQAYYEVEEFEGIKIWYAKNIRPDEEGHPIRIELKKIFLGHDLIIKNAKIDVVTT